MLRQVIRVLSITFLIVGVGACSKNGAAKYALQPKESALLENLLNDDANGFVNSGESLLTWFDGTVVSASEVSKLYEENQVSADQKFYEKTLFLTGTIRGINSGLGNEPYIELASRNEFLSPQIRFDKTDVNKIAALKKGQQIKVVCKGDGAVIGAAMFKDCQFAIDYVIEHKFNTIRSEVDDFLGGKKIDSDKIAGITIYSITLARNLSESSACLSGLNNKCWQEIQALHTANDFKDKVSAVATELKSLGIQTPKL